MHELSLSQTFLPLLIASPFSFVCACECMIFVLVVEGKGYWVVGPF